MIAPRWFNHMIRVVAVYMGAALVMPMAWAAAPEAGRQAPGRAMARQATKALAPWTTSDHTKHPALQKTFSTGQQITEACLSCHSEAQEQFKKTIHWTWIGHTDDSGKQLGKAGDSLNNFCLATNKMQDKGCSSCHTGWQGKKSGVNCLACHSQKSVNWSEAFEDYQAFSGSKDPEEMAIADEIQAEIRASAQNIGRPTRQNCGECHFKGGGGDGVKHGDLDTSLSNPNKALDVHMGVDGQSFECTRCHTTVEHHVAGRIYSKPAYTERKSLIEDDLTAKITCESCHGSTPHDKGHKANDHTDKVACQSCHIPKFARVLPTKMSWDWSKSGKLKDGKKYKEKGPLGTVDYMSIKGQMTWAKNVVPEYAWFNGAMSTMTVKDTIDPARVVTVSGPVGRADDPNSRIFPFKVHRGVQPYDKINNNLLAPLLSGNHGYWQTLDWQDALSRGMKAMEVPYSGQFDFVSSTYYFPTTHMVAPKDNVVACDECHTGNNGRLAGISGVYMPGRDKRGMLDTLGWLAVIGALLGAGLHGLGRIFTNGRKGA
ncbi:MAG: tetrathionate reductase family octaheme c-type cytochrome [Desulfobacteraceae bacterium]